MLDEPTSGLDPLVQETFRSLVRETAADGRTVFLSSHSLDEVQHVADRVGIIRAGRLVAVEAVETLLARSVRHMRLTFAGAGRRGRVRRPARACSRRRATAPPSGCRVRGSADAVVKHAARHEVLDVVSEPADLEEIFLVLLPGAAAVPELLRRAVGDRARTLGGWLIGIAAYIALIVAVFPSIHGSKQFDDLLKQYPDVAQVVPRHRRHAEHHQRAGVPRHRAVQPDAAAARAGAGDRRRRGDDRRRGGAGAARAGRVGAGVAPGGDRLEGRRPADRDRSPSRSRSSSRC